MVDKAFTRKMIGGVFFGTTKYSTTQIEEALKECFKDEPIFGGDPDSSSTYARKVAVTAATETGEQAVVITNYNRASDEQSKTKSALYILRLTWSVNYQLIRPEHPSHELNLWEA